MSDEISRKQKRTFILITLVFLFFIGVLLAEIIIRISWSGLLAVPEQRSKNPYASKEKEEIAYTLAPNFNYNQWGFSTNSLGFRFADSIKEKKPNSTFRIALLGDSNIFGFATSDEDTIASGLERGLNNFTNNKIKKYEVLNFGISGYNTTQYRAVLDKYASRFDPDLIVVGLTVRNDFDGFFHVYLGNGYLTTVPKHNVKGYNYELKVPPSIVWNSYLFRLIYIKVYPDIYRLYKVRDTTLETKLNTKKILCASCDENDDVWESVRENLSAIKELARKNNARLMFLLFPDKAQIVFPDVPKTPQKIVSSILDEYELEYIDLFDNYQTYLDASGFLPYRQKGSHPNNSMYEREANLIRNYVLNQTKTYSSNEYAGKINIGHKDDFRYISYGWGRRWKHEARYRWIRSEKAGLIFPKHKDTANKIEIRCKKYNLINKQKLTLVLNGEPLPTIDVSSARSFQTFRITLPESVQLKDINALDLLLSKAVRSPDDLEEKPIEPELFSLAVESIILL